MYKLCTKYGGKDTIEMEIVPFIPYAKRGFYPTITLAEVIDAIPYKLKTGVQWEQLPARWVFSDKALTWQVVYYHFNKWGKFSRPNKFLLKSYI